MSTVNPEAAVDLPSGSGTEYFEKRKLKSGSAGWILLATLGVANVISGDFSGWNLGLAHGGFGGMLVGFLLMGLMYVCMVFGLAELSSALPAAGAGYGFARRALGKLGGFVTGMAIFLEYTFCPAAISVFIAGYVEALGLFPGLNPIWIYVFCFALFIAIHLIGTGEALRIMFAITAVALVALLAFIFGMLPHFDAANLLNIAPAEGGSALFPFGINGVLAALPFAIWFFIAVEGVPLAAEEAKEPKKDLPRGIIAAVSILTFTGICVLLLAPGGAGASAMGESGAPLVDALNAVGSSKLAVFVNYAGLAGLFASFFGVVFAYSRQLFALSRAGYLPRFLSVTNKRHTPTLALIVPGCIGLLLAALLQNGDLIIDIAVFSAAISYVLMNISHIVLRVKEPAMARGYRTPGGIITTSIALVLSLVALVSTFFVDVVAACCVAVLLAGFVIYFLAYSSKRLVAKAPEEEFALLAEAEKELR
jgi:ethanolamine permease